MGFEDEATYAASDARDTQSFASWARRLHLIALQMG